MALTDLDVLCDAYGNPVVGPDGDLVLATGEETLLQDLANRILTVPGSLPEDAEYGAGLPLFLGSEVTPGLQASLIAAVERQCAKDDRVQPGSVVCRIEVLDAERVRVRLDVETVDGEALGTTVEAV